MANPAAGAHLPADRTDASRSTGEARDAATHATGADASITLDAPRLEFRHKARFVWKVTLLLATFVALIPILLYQHELGARVYLWFLVGVHLVGLLVFGWGVSRHDIAPSTRGFVGRIVGLIAVAGLLYLISQGLTTPTRGVLFWGSLFALWAVHSGGLLLLHVRGRSERSCPFA